MREHKPRAITFKQKQFVKEYIKGKGNGTKAILKTYGTTDPKTASAMAVENLGKQSVKEEMDRILQKEELSLKSITSRLSDIIVSEPSKGFSGADVLDAVKTGLKLHGVLTDRKQVMTLNVNTDLQKLSKYELIERHKKLLLEASKIIEGEEA